MKNNMPQDVFYLKSENKTQEQLARDIGTLLVKSGLDALSDTNDLVAVKMHFGEKGNTTHISPHLVRPVIEKIKERGGKPFLTDTCVLYRSERDNAVDHILTAHDHGFTIQNLGAPVIIADGLRGDSERDVSIPGELFQKVSVATTALEANALFVLSHVTGHMSTGMGGVIKNLGMGFASRKGKLRQHSKTKPAIIPKYCTGCKSCIEWCPAEAISMVGEVANIDSSVCIGCGECLTVCRFSAVKYDWKIGGTDLQKRMAEHALGIVHHKRGKIGYLNYILSVTKDCDCFGTVQTPMIPDIGILASKDPVALDAATLDLIKRVQNRTLMEMSYPRTDPWIQIRHGAKIGLGSDDYRIIEVSG